MPEEQQIRAGSGKEVCCRNRLVFLLDLSSADLAGRTAPSCALEGFVGEHWREGD
jgi:hypothetical protein